MVVAPDTIRLLTEIGLLAAGRGRLRECQEIMQGIAALRPGASQPFIAVALAYLNAGRPADAVRLLRDEALPAVNPEEADMVRAFLGLSLHLDGRPRECIETLDQIRPDSNDSAALRLAVAIRQSL